MPIPRVAIVGRPNVGKSSIMNMVAGGKISIVDPTPGVTRDRVSAIVELDPPFETHAARPRGGVKPVEFVDTGGFGAYTAPGERYDEIGEDLHTLTNSIEHQIGEAVSNADLVLLVLDAQMGVTPQDEEIARLLREGRIQDSRRTLGGGKGEGATQGAKPVKGAKGGARAKPRGGAASGPMIRVVANKTDGPKWESHAQEVAGLGFGEPLMVSAKNNYMRREFLESVYELLPEWSSPPEPQADLKVAIVGKRNAGKSTLVNTLAGEPRVIVSEIAGTTRDAIDVKFEFGGKSVLAIDTAGVRRAKSFQNMVEHFAFDRVERSVGRAEVVLLVVDATVKISQVDEQVAMLAQKGYKPTIIVVNKWDAVEGKPNKKGIPIQPGDYEDYLRKELGGLAYAPIAFVSGKTGKNVRQTIELAFDLRDQSRERVTTGKLNRIIRRIMETRAPTDTVGTHAKIYYIAQTGIAPPTITMVVNYPELFRPNYMRFLANRFREELPFVEVPMRLVVRARRQREGDIAEDPESMVNIATGVVKSKRKRLHEVAKNKPTAPSVADVPDREMSEAELATFADDAAVYFDE